MSSIGSIGGFGGMGLSLGGGLGAIGGAGAVGGAGATGATAPTGSPTDIQAGLPPNMQSLVDSLKDFSSAEILLALMIANAGSKKDKDGGSSAAAGFLAGMAMAGMMSQSSNIGNLQGNAPMTLGNTGGVGLSLNVSL